MKKKRFIAKVKDDGIRIPGHALRSFQDKLIIVTAEPIIADREIVREMDLVEIKS